MPKITRNCDVCGKGLDILVDEDGEVLSDAYYLGNTLAGDERWVCQGCRHAATAHAPPKAMHDAMKPSVPASDADPIPEVVDAEFCQWLAGWTDGRGRFRLRLEGNAFVWAYETEANSGEVRVLEYVQRELGMGRIEPQTAGGKLVIEGEAAVELLVVVFEHYALKNPQKAAEFQIWCEAFEFDRHRVKRDADYHQAMRLYQKRLADLRSAGPKKQAKRQTPAPQEERSLFD